MARKNYSDEFRRQAVKLYESTPGATVRGIAEDLGIGRSTLRTWLDQFGTGRKTAADGTATRSPLTPRSARRPRAGGRPVGGRECGAAGRSRPSWSPSGRSCARRPSISPGDELVTRFQFVADHSTTSSDLGTRPGWSVKRRCVLVQIERSSFYAWTAAAAPARAARAAAEAELAARIRTVHAADRTCGAPRITAELYDSATPERRVNHKRVARVMREQGIHGYRRRRTVRTTIPEPADTTVPDLLGRDFTAPEPNRVYVGDITYLPLAQDDNLYLATVIDCFSRCLIAWSIADHMRTELVGHALRAAAATRASLTGAIFHSDYAEPCVKPRNRSFACAGGVRWLIPRLNEPVIAG